MYLIKVDFHENPSNQILCKLMNETSNFYLYGNTVLFEMNSSMDIAVIVKELYEKHNAKKVISYNVFERQELIPSRLEF